MRIGIGLGAFADGFSRGVGLGNTLKGVRDERELETIRKEGLGEARAQRDAAIDQSIMTLPGAEGAPEQYQVGDQAFTDRDKAREVAGESVGSTIDFWLNGPAKKFEESLVEKGDMRQLEAWNSFKDGRRGRSAMEDWSKAFMAARSGDYDSAAKGYGQYYSKYVDPNMEYLGHETLSGDDGPTGFIMKARNKRTGKEIKVPVGLDEFIQAGLAANPQSLFQSTYQQQLTADKAQLQDAQDERKFRRQQSGRIDLEYIKGNIKNANEQAKFDRNVDVLRRAGYDEAFINSVIPSLIGADTSGPYRKGRSPEETAAMLHEKRVENDYEYRSLSPEKQREIIQQDMQMIREIAEPFMQGRQQPSGRGVQPSGPQQGVPVLDTRTGQVTYR